MSALLTADTLPFPPRRDAVRGKWAALYLEPVIGSGERICIGVAAASARQSIVVPVVALNRLECIYGREVDALLLASRIALEHMTQALRRSGEAGLTEGWKGPVDGCFLGAAVECEGDSLDMIARTGMTASSSLVEMLAEGGDEVDPRRDSQITASRLEDLVKERVVAVRSGLAQCFRVQRRIQANARPTVVGFVGQRIAANFAMLMPSQLSNLVDRSKAKLWDLAQLRQDVQGERLLQSILHFELLVYRPRDEAPEYSEKQIRNIREAVVELEAEADRVQIRCRPATSHEEIAQRLLEAEAA